MSGGQRFMIRLQTPAAASERSGCSRWYMDQKLSGRSRHGAPDRKVQKMPLKP